MTNKIITIILLTLAIRQIDDLAHPTALNYVNLSLLIVAVILNIAVYIKGSKGEAASSR